MKIVAKFFENFFEQEIPTGAVDGVNTDFTLSSNPVYDKALRISLGGLTQTPGIDYTVSSKTVSFTTPPAPGLKILAIYIKR